MEVTLELAARMAVLAGKAKTPAEGRRLCEGAVASGEARKLFLANVERQGGDVGRMLALRGNYRSPHSATVAAPRGGFVSRLDAWKIGLAGVTLGVGRNRTEDAVSPDVGVSLHRKRGSAVRTGDAIMTVWAKDGQSLEAALPLLRDAVSYSDAPPPPRALVLKEIASK
jgi:pyrimidine-nucleoside phosphorylase